MSIATMPSHGVPIVLWTKEEEIEQAAKQQLYNIATLPWVFHHVAVMPDVHYGKGATVGSVVAMKGAVSPAAVGVDIGCGMGAVKTNIRADQLPDSLKPLRLAIEAAIPVGFEQHEEPVFRHSSADARFFDAFPDLHRGVQDFERKARCQIGTLGGGNHFIELCLDTQKNVWLMLHSGSRYIGNKLAEIHIRAAQKLAHNRTLPDRDLAVFLSGTSEMDEYLRDLEWAQEYAYRNRRAMFEIYTDVVLEHFPFAKFERPILCHHNYVSRETHFGEDLVITRKGAIYAGAGALGIIPGSMGDKSYIVRGLGSEESFCSASHGAGRVMSRGAAKRKFTLDDFIEQTRGVECRKSEGLIDEIPGAYKRIDQVMANQKDLVEVVAELKQVLSVKGDKE